MLEQAVFVIKNYKFVLKQLIKLLKKLLKRNSKRLTLLLIACSTAYAFIKYRKYYKKSSSKLKNLSTHIKPNESLLQMEKLLENGSSSIELKTKKTPSINKEFFIELKYLLRVMLPSLWSKQVLFLLMHTATLVSRTFLSIYVAKLEGLIVKSIVQKSKHDFLIYLLKWLSIAIPATTCNSLIRYLESKLDLELKLNLVNKSLKFYFNNRIYYQIALKQYEHIQIDQNLTEDIEKLTNLLVHLYSHLTKPILDISLITVTLISLAKQNNFNYFLPTALGVGVISLTGMLLRLISPRFGQMAAEEAKRKGYLRYLYTRIQTNSEEIAFYGGEATEYNLIQKNFMHLKKHLEYIYLNKLWYIVFEQFLMKYVWSAAGLSMISIPILIGRSAISDPSKPSGLDGDDNLSVSTRTEQFTTARNLLNSSADAVERILTSYKEIIELTGYTRRVYDMFQIFRNCYTMNENIKLKPLISKAANTSLVSSNLDIQFIDRNKLTGKMVEYTDEIQSDIVIDSISIVTPNGDIIVPSLSLKLKTGMNLLITGPNGCGKSSLFRIIGGLWPLYSGTIHRPKLRDFFYIPQKPYLPIGSLRDQIIYPDTLNDMKRKSINDENLMEILSIVNLQYVVSREGGLDALADWKDVLSGGEKQRIGLARLFYHKPKYAFLDECTSAISIDVEGKIYQTAKDVYKITLLTIAHRASLWQYHNYILQFDGHGNWKFEELNANLDERLNLKQEKDSLEKQLLGISSSKTRLQELCSILGEDSVALQ